MHALRRDPERFDPDFSELLEELQFFMGPVSQGQPVKACPGADSNVPLWLLGSSTYSAQLAALKGLPFAFASHFAPDAMMRALDIYRSNFQPSEQLDKPYVMIGVNVVVAETTEEANFLATTEKQKFLQLIRGGQGKIPAPVNDMDSLWQPHEKQQVNNQLRESIHGDKALVLDKLQSLVERTQADEIMAHSVIFDHQKKLRSYELLAELKSEQL